MQIKRHMTLCPPVTKTLPRSWLPLGSTPANPPGPFPHTSTVCGMDLRACAGA